MRWLVIFKKMYCKITVLTGVMAGCRYADGYIIILYYIILFNILKCFIENNSIHLKNISSVLLNQLHIHIY